MWLIGPISLICPIILYMAKNTTIYVCSECGEEQTTWQGKCSVCSAWNSFKQLSVSPSTAKTSSTGARQVSAELVLLSKVDATAHTKRSSSGIAEFDLVLGGGFVPGSLVLLGGDPGIGKSTLALQSALVMAKSGQKVIYVSGEESAEQIKLRKMRIDAKTDLAVIASNDLESILPTLEKASSDLVVIDSIQTIFSQNINGVAGGVAQVAYATNQLLRLAKTKNITCLLIGHVTKDGNLAGPKTLEHMVDCVLYLEGERFGPYRFLRASKNRFGALGEVGVFEMDGEGLTEVKNPSSMFLEHQNESSPGTVTTAALEGNKVLLLEVQSLCVKTSMTYPKRATSGYDTSRLQLILAILQKTLKLNFSELDVYVNVAGGFSLDDRASDLAVALSLVSSYLDKSVPTGSICFGELGLLGEIRRVPQLDKRVSESVKLDFKTIIGGSELAESKVSKTAKLLSAKTLSELCKQLFR